MFKTENTPQSLIEEFFGKSSMYNHTTKTIHSNQWFSSLYNQLPSQPLYTFPLAYRLTEKGLGFSYPEISATKDSIAAPYVEDFTIGTQEDFTSQDIEEISDWSIKASLNSRNNKMDFLIGHGIPHTTIFSNNNLIITLPHPFSIYPSNQNDETKDDTFDTTPFVLSTRNHNYLIYPKNGDSIKINNNSLELYADEVFIALLPDKKLYSNFLEIADNPITATGIEFNISDNIQTTFSAITDSGTTLLALFPHQINNLTEKTDILGSYSTLRGNMDLIKANSFTTTLPTPNLNDSFPDISNTVELASQVRLDASKILSSPIPESQNYFLGTYFGKISTLIQLADVAKLSDVKKELVNFVSPVFIDSLNNFEYNPEKTSLIAKNSEFGNNELNDHHFHYGYFIRTAAVLLKENPQLRSEIEPIINEMVNDIATSDRKSSKYPFLRNFDPYEGHSWASGYADFFDGNNQESTSEALNAWYSLYLWAKITNNEKLENYATFLFASELNSTKYYWFNTLRVYQEPYNHQIASIVWGGKVDFSTWFSSNPNMIYGIQLLPFTPASIYLAEIMPYDKYENDFLNSGGNYLSPWGDLMEMWKSFSEPNAQSLTRDNFQENNPQSLYIYYLMYNRR